MAKYVVTGGAGFIGSHLVDELVEAGHEVVAFDNLSSGKQANVNPRATFFHGDVRDGETVLEAFARADGVFHLAARARVQVSINDPLGTHDVNVNGTLCVLESARRTKVRRVVFASSSSVYGDRERLPAKETDQPYPQSPYAQHKLIGEQYCAMYSRLYGLSTVCLRFFNVYGPRFDPKGAYALVIGKFIMQRLVGEWLTVTGDGGQTRDFTHVSDVVRACTAAMAVDWNGGGECINIGASKPASINYVASLIGGPITHIAARPEPRATCADNSRARGMLGWEPTVLLESGIRHLKREYGL